MEKKIQGRVEELEKSMEELKERKLQLQKTTEQVEKAIREVEIAMVSRVGAISELKALLKKEEMKPKTGAGKKKD